jgi:hypothetical protein
MSSTLNASHAKSIPSTVRVTRSPPVCAQDQKAHTRRNEVNRAAVAEDVPYWALSRKWALGTQFRRAPCGAPASHTVSSLSCDKQRRAAHYSHRFPNDPTSWDRARLSLASAVRRSRGAVSQQAREPESEVTRFGGYVKVIDAQKPDHAGLRRRCVSSAARKSSPRRR